MKDVSHVRYDSERCVWRFRVLHFSRYNLRGMKRGAAATPAPAVAAPAAPAAAAAGGSEADAAPPSRQAAPARRSAPPPARSIDEHVSGEVPEAAPERSGRGALPSAAAAAASVAAADAAMSDGESSGSAGPPLGRHDLTRDNGDESAPAPVHRGGDGDDGDGDPVLDVDEGRVKRPRTALGVMVGFAPETMYKMQSMLYGSPAAGAPAPPEPAAVPRGVGVRGDASGGYARAVAPAGRSPAPRARTMAQMLSPGPLAGPSLRRAVRPPVAPRAASGTASAASTESVGVPPAVSRVMRVVQACPGVSVAGGVLVGAPLRTDPAFRCGRSFRASFGPNGELIMPRITTSPADGRRARVVTIVSTPCAPSRDALWDGRCDETALHVSRRTFHGNVDYLLGQLRAAQQRGAQVPEAGASTLADIVGQLAEYAYAAESGGRLAAAAGTASQRWCAQATRTWRLVNALWGAETGADGQLKSPHGQPRADERSDIAEVLFRRECIAGWLQDTLAEQRSAGVLAAPEPAALVWVAAVERRLADAARAALATKDFNLAVLLTQAGTDQESAGYVLEFVNDLKRRDMVLSIDKARMNLYRLLAGNVGDLSLEETRALSWEQAFGVYFWYGVPPAAAIDEAVAAFDRAVAGSLVATPRPWWAGAGTSFAGVDGDLDGCYALLKFSTSTGGEKDSALLAALCPAGSSPDTLDYELPVGVRRCVVVTIDCSRVRAGLSLWHAQWHLHAVLSSLSLCDSLPADVECRLRRGFAAQLEASGQWREAVYVMLRVVHKSPSEVVLSSAVDAARAILERHGLDVAACLTADSEPLLQGALRVPQAWLAGAAAMRALYDGKDDAATVDAAIAAEWWDVAHAVLCHRAVPREVISEPSLAFSHRENRERMQLEKLESAVYEGRALTGAFAADWQARGLPLLDLMRVHCDELSGLKAKWAAQASVWHGEDELVQELGTLVDRIHVIVDAFRCAPRYWGRRARARARDRPQRRAWQSAPLTLASPDVLLRERVAVSHAAALIAGAWMPHVAFRA